MDALLAPAAHAGRRGPRYVAVASVAWQRVQEQLGTGWRLGAGALSGLLAQSATYPLDIVRRPPTAVGSDREGGFCACGGFRRTRRRRCGSRVCL